MGRQKRVSFMRNNFKRDIEILNLVRYDVSGPIDIKSLGGATYFVTFIVDASKTMWVFPIKGKDQVVDIFLKFHMDVERETNKRLRCIRTNNSGEDFSKEFEEYCSKHGIKHVKIVPAPQNKMEQLRE